MGAAGNVIMFVLTVAGTVIVSLYVFVYSAWVLRDVIENVASGNHTMSWSSDTFADKIGFALPLLGIFVVWMMPSALVARALRPVWLTHDPNLRFLILGIPGLWLLVPVGILSMLTSESSWAILRPTVVVQMARLFWPTVLFYATTAVAAVLASVVWYFQFRKPLWMLAVTAPLSAALLMIYGRLLGRLAWLIGRLRPLKRRKKSESDETNATNQAEAEPVSAPKEEQKTRKKRKPKPVPEESRFDEDDMYAVGEQWQPDESESEPPHPEPEPEPESKPKTQSLRAKIPPLPKGPTSSLFRGTLTFPFHGTNLAVFLALSIGFAAVGVGVMTALVFFPF